MSENATEFKEHWDRLRSICELALCAQDTTPEAIPTLYGDFRTQLEKTENAFVRIFSELLPTDGQAIRGIIKHARGLNPETFLDGILPLPQRMEAAWAGDLVGPTADQELELTGLADPDSDTRQVRGLTRDPTRSIIISSRPGLPLRKYAVWLMYILVLVGIGYGISKLVGSGGEETENPDSASNTNDQDGPKNGGTDVNTNEGTDTDSKGIFVSVEPVNFPVNSSMKLAEVKRMRPGALIKLLDLRYSRRPEGREVLQAQLGSLLADDAKWRKAGTSAALSDQLLELSHLEAYPQSVNLLPSEVAKLQGGTPMALAVFYLYFAEHLGLEVDGVSYGATESGEIYAPRLAGNAYFYAPQRRFSATEQYSVEVFLTNMVEALVERELLSLQPGLMDLVEYYAARRLEPEKIAQYLLRYRTGLLALGLKRSAAQTAQLHDLLIDTVPAEIDRRQIIDAIGVLGGDANVEWWGQLYAMHPSHVNLTGISAAELLMDLLRKAGEPNRQKLEKLIMRAMELTPDRRSELLRKLEAIGGTDLVLEQARERYEKQGDRTEETIVTLVRAELNEGSKTQALAYLSMLLRSDAELSSSGPELAAQAISLALELKLVEEATALINNSSTRWPGAALIMKLRALFLIHTNHAEEGIELLRQYVKANPMDQGAAKLLTTIEQ